MVLFHESQVALWSFSRIRNTSLLKNFGVLLSGGELSSVELVLLRSANFLSLKRYHAFIGRSPKVINVLGTLVSFKASDQVWRFGDQTWECRHRSAQTSCNFLLDVSSAVEIECKHFQKQIVRHLETMISLGAQWTKLGEEKISLQSVMLRLTKCLPGDFPWYSHLR